MKPSLPCRTLAALCCLALCAGAAMAQPSCPGNVVTNGGFNLNTVIQNDGSMGSGSTTNAWTAAYGSPQLQGGAGCHDPNYISFWGNQAVGEAIQQPVNFQAGHTYSISFCAHYQPSPGKVIPNVTIVLRGSTSPLTGTACPAGSCETIYTTPSITSQSWSTYTACWTPKQNEKVLTISPSNGSNVNDGSQVSFGQIDDVCIHEVTAPVIEGPKDTCTTPATYCVKPPANGPFNWSVNGGTFQPESGDGSCILVTWTQPAGSVHVTSTVNGCPFSSSLNAGECLRPPCCRDIKATLVDSELTSDGVALTVALSGPQPATIVTATILGASHVVTPSGCGANGTIAASASSSQPPAPSGWAGPTVPFVNGNEVLWQSVAGNGNALGQFTFNVHLPALGSFRCSDEVTICIEFEVTYPSVNGQPCRTCKTVQCFKVPRALPCPECL